MSPRLSLSPSHAGTRPSFLLPWSRPIVIGLVAAAAVWLTALSITDIHGRTFHDFDVFYSTATAVRHGDPLYETAQRWRDLGLSHGLPGNTEPSSYVYPPVFALALTPLTLLPFRLAAALWYTLSLTAVLGAVVVLLRMLLPVRGRALVAAIVIAGAVVTSFGPMRLVLGAGQADALLLLFVALTLSDCRHGRDVRSGLWLGVAVAIKPFLGFLILFLLWKRMYRGAVVAGTVAAGLFLLPLPVVGWRSLVDSVTVIRYFSGPVFGVSPHNQSLYGMALRLFTDNAFTRPLVDAPVLVTLLRGAVVVAVLVTVARVIRHGRPEAAPAQELVLEYGLAVAAMLLVSPHTEDRHLAYLTLALVPVGVVTGWSMLSGRDGRMIALALGGIWAYLSLPHLSRVQYAFDRYMDGPVGVPWLFLTGVDLYGLCAAALLTVMALRTLRRAAHAVTGGAGSPAAPPSGAEAPRPSMPAPVRLP